MTAESQSNQKTEEELFNEIMEAKAAGKDFGSIVDKVEIVEDPTNPVVVEEPPVEEPADPPAKEEPVVEEKDTPAPETGAWEDTLPDDVKEKIRLLREEKNQLEHRVKSELGRVPFLQRKVDELSRQLSTTPATVKETPASSKTSTTSKFAEKLAEARAVDPALADLLEALKAEIEVPLREELTNEVNQTKALFVDKEQEQLWASEKAKLLAAVPQADDVFKHPLYKQWKQELPENMYRLASSIYADDVVVALEQFAKYAERVAPELVNKPAAVVTPPVVVDNTAADKVAADRARKLNSTPPVTTQGTPKGGDGIPEDPDALFKYLTEKIRKGESYKV